MPENRDGNMRRADQRLQQEEKIQEGNIEKEGGTSNAGTNGLENSVIKSIVGLQAVSTGGAWWKQTTSGWN